MAGGLPGAFEGTEGKHSADTCEVSEGHPGVESDSSQKRGDPALQPCPRRCARAPPAPADATRVRCSGHACWQTSRIVLRSVLLYSAPCRARSLARFAVTASVLPLAAQRSAQLRRGKQVLIEAVQEARLRAGRKLAESKQQQRYQKIGVGHVVTGYRGVPHREYERCSAKPSDNA